LLSLFLVKPRFPFRLFHAVVFFIVLLNFLAVLDGFVRKEGQNVLFILFLYICVFAAFKNIVNRLNQVIELLLVNYAAVVLENELRNCGLKFQACSIGHYFKRTEETDSF
jgi:hypothetical protein